MIRWRMANIIKRFARHRDDMRLVNFQRVRGLDAEWKLLRCPTEYCLPNLTPLWAKRNLGANRSDVVLLAVATLMGSTPSRYGTLSIYSSRSSLGRIPRIGLSGLVTSFPCHRKSVSDRGETD